MFHTILAMVSQRDSSDDAAPKTGRSRRAVHVSEFAMSALIQHRARQAAQRLAAGSEWRDYDLVFSSSWGRPLS